MPETVVRSIAVLLACCAVGMPAAAQTVATKPDVTLPADCGFAQPARMIASLKEAPALAAAFKRAKLDIADVGDPFVPYDIVDEKSRGLPHRAFLRAYEFKDRTIVWYYRGGLGTHVNAVEFRMLRDTSDTAATLRMTRNALTGPPCRATQALLNGVTGTDW